MALSEFALIRRFFQRRALVGEDSATILGIGDDAAIIDAPADRQLVVAADTLVESVHFPASTPAQHIGYRALAVNLSDLAAMGAEPRWYTLCLTMPQVDERWLEDFCGGLQRASAGLRLGLIGGDTTSGALAVSVQILGLVRPGGGLLRSGARVGDAVFVTGTTGDAAAGLALLQAGAVASDRDRYLVDRFYRPEPRLAVAALLPEVATSCIDISDGLLADLGHICRASGVGARIRAADLPLSEALASRGRGRALPLALGGGDDYELCFTAPVQQLSAVRDMARRTGTRCTRIGEIVAEPGVDCVDENNATLALKQVGYEHFRQVPGSG